MKKNQEDYAAELSKCHARWVHLYTHGGQDPFWPDGANLNLVHNHILYYRGKIEETMPPENYPSAYFQEVPPEVDQNYMARPDEILAAAKASLAAYQADPNYQYLLRHQGDFSPKTRQKLPIDAVLNYAQGLKRAIENNDLITMRRHERAEGYLDSFASCAQKMRDAPPEDVQLDLFSPAAGDDTDSEEGEEFGGMAMM